MTRSNSTAPHERAVVIGGSMVGMAVARALAEQFREVVVVERDVPNRAAPEHRRGVPQSHHIHNLLLRGQHELEELFPGFVQTALGLGAVQLDYGKDVARCTNLGFCPFVETGFVALSATRVLFEFAERRRLSELCSNITWLEGTRVEDMLIEGEAPKWRAVGVRTDHAERAEIRADLVVDCSGRSYLWKKWFSERGVPLPKETVVDSRSGYATRFYRRKSEHRQAWKGMSIDPLYPERPQYAVMALIEHDTWVVTIGGINEHYPPSDEQGFEEFCRKLQTPLLGEWLSEAEPVSPIRTFRKIEKRWHAFESYGHPVARFLAVGDSAWSFNPQYGQGMTIGIGCARILRDVLRRDPNLDTLARRYYPAAKKFAGPPWNSTALLDFAWPGTQGDKPWYTELHRMAGHFFLRSCQFEDDVFMAFIQLLHLLKQPHEVITPRVLFGLARYGLRRLTASLPASSFTRLPSSSSSSIAE